MEEKREERKREERYQRVLLGDGVAEFNASPSLSQANETFKLAGGDGGVVARALALSEGDVEVLKDLEY